MQDGNLETVPEHESNKVESLNMTNFRFCLESGFTSKFFSIFMRAKVNSMFIVNISGDLMFQIMLYIWYVCQTLLVQS